MPQLSSWTDVENWSFQGNQETRTFYMAHDPEPELSTYGTGIKTYLAKRGLEVNFENLGANRLRVTIKQ